MFGDANEHMVLKRAKWIALILVAVIAWGISGEAYGQFLLKSILSASDGKALDTLGYSSGISGNWIISGAPGRSNSTGVAYLYKFSNGVWTQQQILVASDGVRTDYFGSAVAIYDDTAIVGAYNHTVDGVTNCGAVYVYRWNGASWTENQKLTDPDAANTNTFGQSVAFNNKYAFVGSIQVDDIASDAGAAFVYKWNGTSWEQMHKLLPLPMAVANSYFGWSVGISGKHAVVGAIWDTGIIGSTGNLRNYCFVPRGTIFSVR